MSCGKKVHDVQKKIEKVQQKTDTINHIIEKYGRDLREIGNATVDINVLPSDVIENLKLISSIIDESFAISLASQKKYKILMRVMVFLGLLNIDFNSPFWKIVVDEEGGTLAHWLSRNNPLNVPLNHSIWSIRDINGVTPAHYAAFSGFLGASWDEEIWRIRSCDGKTPLHYAAMNKKLTASYDNDVWLITDSMGRTPAHSAAFFGNLDADYESPLWRIPDETGITPAHLAARYSTFLAPFDSSLWYIIDKVGDTPAHCASLRGNFNPPYESDLWGLQNSTGDTPAHFCAKTGLKIPYSSRVWMFENFLGETPADSSSKTLEVLAHQPTDVMCNYLKTHGVLPLQPLNAVSFLGLLRILSFNYKFDDKAWDWYVKEFQKYNDWDKVHGYLDNVEPLVLLQNSVNERIVKLILGNPMFFDPFHHAVTLVLIEQINNDPVKAVQIIRQKTDRNCYRECEILHYLDEIGWIRFLDQFSACGLGVNKFKEFKTLITSVIFHG